MANSEIESYIESAANNLVLLEEKSFDARADILDFLEFHILDQLEALQKNEPDQDRLMRFKHRVADVKLKLEGIDNRLFQRLQQEIRQKKYRGQKFEEQIRGYVSFENTNYDQEGYDNLDIFINRLLSLQHMPEPSKPLEPEMVFYQKTPARIIFELVKQAGFTKDDVFFDIGSGLGQVVMLVNLLAGIRAVGVEFDSAFCKYSEECAAMLGSQGVSFINVDAREADYSSGTVFFMYTPFRGKMLQDVLKILRKESLKREIHIVTYGPCTTEVAEQDWLYSTSGAEFNINKLTFFSTKVMGRAIPSSGKGR